jgi:DAPG hydrolase PhiG domain
MSTPRALERERRLAHATPVENLLDPGYHAVETGYCELSDGTAYLASQFTHLSTFLPAIYAEFAG